MQKIFLATLVLVLIGISGCAKIPEIRDGDTIVTNKVVRGVPVLIKLTRGSAYGSIVKIGSHSLRINPQVSIWVGDSSGSLKQNIYITRCFAKQDWKSVKNHPDSTYRISCFPYWLGKLKSAGLPFPSKANPLPDAVTSATPPGSFTIETYIDSTIVSGTIWCEFNSSFDNNETWPKINNESFNGQPSLIYSCNYSQDVSGKQVMKYCGHGGDTGNDHTLYEKNSGITSAQEIFSEIEININPDEMASRFASAQ